MSQGEPADLDPREESLRQIGDAALRASEARFRAVAELSPTGIFECDRDGSPLYMNPAAERILGVSLEAARQGAWKDVVPPDELRRVLDAWARFAGGGAPFQAEFRVRRGPGDAPDAILLVRATPVRDASGTPTSYMGVLTDVTDVHLAEESSRRSEVLYRTMARHFPRGILGLFDTDLRMLLVDGTRSVLPAGPREAEGRRPAEFLPGEEGKRVEAAFREALAGRPGHADVHVRGRVFEIQAHPVRDAAGNVIMGLVMTEDTTDARTVQAQLQVASRLAALGTLVAGVAHEINNPLAGQLASQGFAVADLQELRRDLAGEHPPDAKAVAARLADVVDALGDAEAAGRRIARIVKDLTTFGRADQRRSPTRLADVVAASLRWLKATSGQPVAIRTEIQEVPDVLASAGQIEQVLVNVVSNATKAIPRGRAGVVTVRLGPGEAGRVRLEVEDNGVGMSAEVLDRIFDPFYTTRTVGHGMGLGLPLCHAIVTAHGGTIAVTSTPGAGSTFRIELPAVEPGDASPDA